MGRNLERAIGALNGVVGDYLERTGNGLATPMQLVRDGAPVDPTPEALAALAGSPAPRRIVLLVHGLMSTEDVFLMADGETYASLLARDLGFAAVEVRYNSGRRISDTGAALDALLARLAAGWPGEIDEIALVGHSMGGLVIRAATHTASERASAWLPLVKRAFYLGSPHLGAPLERFGNAVSWALGKVGHPVTRLIADIVNLRSAGVKDLRYGNLRREDWEGRDADALLQNTRHPVPLLPHIRHHLVVGSLSPDVQSVVLLGDVLVPVRSAAGRAAPRDRCALFPQEHVRILPGFHHLRLAHDPAVYELLRAWCQEGEGEETAALEAPGKGTLEDAATPRDAEKEALAAASAAPEAPRKSPLEEAETPLSADDRAPAAVSAAPEAPQKSPLEEAETPLSADDRAPAAASAAPEAPRKSPLEEAETPRAAEETPR